MKKLFGLLALILVTSSSAFAGALDKKLVDAEAKWVAHLDLDKFKMSEIGEYVLVEMEKSENKFAAMKAMTHFDPRKDLNGLTLYSAGGAEEDAVVLINGVFDQEQLMTLVRANDTYEELQMGSHRVASWIDEKKADERGNGQTYGCFVGEDLLVMGSRRPRMEQALAVLSGTATSLAQSSPHLSVIPDAGESYFLAAANMTRIDNVDPQAKVFKKAKSAALLLGEKENKLSGRMSMATDSTDTAEQIAMVVEGIRAMLMLSADEDPHAAKMARAIGINHENNKVDLELSFPIDETIDMMKENQKKDRKNKRMMKNRRKNRVD